MEAEEPWEDPVSFTTWMTLGGREGDVGGGGEGEAQPQEQRTGSSIWVLYCSSGLQTSAHYLSWVVAFKLVLRSQSLSTQGYFQA